MAKVIKYKFLSCEVNHGTEEEPIIEQTVTALSYLCSNENYEHDYAIAKTIAYNGEVTVEEVADPETPDTPTGDDSVWEELDKAYQEGVDSV